jgi:uncharacterized protein (PEP-CTERM system associated)
MVSTASNKRAFVLICLISPALAVAGDWKFSSGISLGEHYTDNARLQAAGQEQTEWITEITPHLGVQREGARLKVNADYSLQGLLYAGGPDNNKVRQNLNARANAELLQEWFFLDATARLSHEATSLANSPGLGDAVGINNTTSVGSYSLSPYLKHRFGSFATVEARIARDGVFIGNSQFTDTNTTRYTLHANSGSAFNPLSWGADYSKTDNSNSNHVLAPDTSSETANLNAHYRLSQKFGLVAQAGKEKNNFIGANAALRDYSYYGVGASYTQGRRFSMDVLYNTSDNGDFVSGSVSLSPTLRTSIKAATSRRAYGRSYSLDLTHRARHSNWSLRYQDELTTSQQQFVSFAGYLCPVGAQPPDASCVPVFGQTQNNATYLSKNLMGSVNYTLRRNTWTLSLYNNQRDYQTGDGGSETTRGLQASWSLRPAVRTTFALTAGLSKAEASATSAPRNDDLWNVGLVATRQIRTKVTGSVEVRHQARNSNQPGEDYKENSIAARVNMSF